MFARTFSVTAKHVIADAGTILDGATVIVHGGSVAEIGPAESLGKIKTDERHVFKNGALHPGFINAHCHLELSHMRGKLKPKTGFTKWAMALMALRRETGSRETATGVRLGLSEMMETGTTCAGDVSTTGGAVALLAQSGMRSVIFHEVTGFDPAVAPQKLAELKNRVESAPRSALITNGVSPHAVFSVSPELMRAAARYAKKTRAPLCVHMCETPDEALFTQRGKGPFAGLLETLGIPAGQPPRLGPVNAAARADALDGALLVHMNYPNHGDIATLARNKAKVVYCPNSNRWFGRKPDHPLMKLLARGIPVGLGTDSLASNTALDVRAEAREAMRIFPELSAERVFHMMTQGGAQALGIGGGLGSLRPGAPFDAAVAEPRLGRRADPRLAIIRMRGGVRCAWVGGKRIFNARR